ncbi:putative tripeptidyl-peptidase II [Rosa chinensis]|uniref:Putative tripeptidyl-peptidase II n=1 Tax=Rosa chinensis TaxID=74649 RepID=A0A2P6RYT0_ROSCH|nr:subtilisin-like protease SBT1.4 [Rosa chinensis]PRQ51585.1 putative tripeptidyl-peptidase II [Rosa chinensis]
MAVSSSSSSSFIFFFLVLCLLHLTSSFSTDQSDAHRTFIVHVSKYSKPSLFSSHRRWYTSLLRSLPPSPHPTKLLYTYSRAVHGFSATLSPSQAHALQSHPAVLSVVPDMPRQLHTTRTYNFLGLADNFGLWPNSDYADDVIIGVLDTGIWPERPSFSDSGLGPVPETWKGKCVTAGDFPASACNRKIIGARAYFNGYESHLGKPMDESNESTSPRDTEGHGTHTASTAGGSRVSNASFYEYAYGEARGMASKARIAAYKICWTFGCFDSDILAAMDQAIADGVHIISLSVGASGGAPPYDRDSIAIGAFGAAQHGVLVSASAGNSGPGAFTATNIAPWILTVGASTLDREFPADVVLGDGRVFNGVSLYSGEGLVDFKLPLVYGGDCGSRYCYSGSLQPSKVQGKIVVCDRGGNARVAKGGAVKLAGGLGMIMANTEESGEELLADSHLVPAAMVGQIAADQIRSYIRLGNYPTATIKFRGTVIGPSPPSPKVASFSSRGPNSLTPEILKPDVIAPGVNILAGWTGASSPTDLDIDSRRVEFNIISGTSMSCPHVSGIAALLRKAYPEWSPAAIKSALVTTAYTLDNSGKKIEDLANGRESTPFVHGAGHVDPNRALNPGLVYDINVNDYVAFMCSIGYGPRQIAVFVREFAGDDICARHSLASPGDLNYPSFAVVFKPGQELVKYKRVVTNVGSVADAVYEVNVDAPAGVEISVEPSKLVFSEENQTQSYEVRFAKGVGYGNGERYGSIEWSNGHHHVRSPVAVRWSNTGYSASI